MLGAFVDLNRNSELIAVRALGVSAWRFILPAAGAAFALGLATLAVLNPMAAVMNSAFESVRAQISPQDGAQVRTIWLRQGDAHTQVIIGAASRTGIGGVALKDASLFVYTQDEHGALEFSRRIEAQEGAVDEGLLAADQRPRRHARRQGDALRVAVDPIES